MNPSQLSGPVAPAERHLHPLAAVELPPKAFLHAQQHGLQVNRVSVRNQKSRWGSCSRCGSISLNWRLIQAPEFVLTHLILHELMHMKQMNHSPKFWREVEAVCPSFPGCGAVVEDTWTVVEVRLCSGPMTLVDTLKRGRISVELLC